MAKKKVETRFEDRYELATGYPWAIGLGPYIQVQINRNQTGVNPRVLNWPTELWAANVPQYRLVLERVTPTRKAKP
jgi:hypothetical protein